MAQINASRPAQKPPRPPIRPPKRPPKPVPRTPGDGRPSEVDGAGERIRTAGLPFTRSMARCAVCASCTDSAAHSPADPHRAGMIRQAVPRPVPRRKQSIATMREALPVGVGHCSHLTAQCRGVHRRVSLASEPGTASRCIALGRPDLIEQAGNCFDEFGVISDLCQQRSEWFSAQLATIGQELAQVGYCLRTPMRRRIASALICQATISATGPPRSATKLPNWL